MKILFTIATNSHLGNAKALFQSFEKHNKNYCCIIGLIDEYKNVPKNLQLNNSNIIICPFTDIELCQVKQMAKKYSPFEFSCAMKPFFAQHLIEKYKPSHIVYLDSDIIVYDNLLIENILFKQSIILTPHCTEPYNEVELNLLNYGLYNAGFFALNNDLNANSFLEWWKTNLVDNCVIDLNLGKYVDQIWLNLVPLYFDSVLILKHLGYNVARWNLKQRNITETNNSFIVNGKFNLIFFHYSGYNFIKHYFPTDNPFIPLKVQNESFTNILNDIKTLLTESNVSDYLNIKPSYGFQSTLTTSNNMIYKKLNNLVSNVKSNFKKSKMS